MIVQIVFLLFLFVAAVIDLKERRVPNRLNLIATVVLPIVAILFSSKEVLLDQFKGGVYTFTLFLLVFVMSLWLRGSPEIGAGDLKMGFWFGFGVGYEMINYVLLSSILYVFFWRLVRWMRYTEWKAPLPYVPVLFISVVVFMFW